MSKLNYVGISESSILRSVESIYHPIGESMGFDCEIIATAEHKHQLKNEEGQTVLSVYELAKIHLARHCQDSQDWHEFVTECLGVFHSTKMAYQFHPDGPVKVTMMFNDEGLDSL